MLQKYKNYLNENINNMKFTVKCKINKDYLLEVSGQSNIKDAIKNELNWTDTITLIDINEIDKENYELLINVDTKIIEDTDAHDVVEGIFYEFQWLSESGIFIKKVGPNDKR